MIKKQILDNLGINGLNDMQLVSIEAAKASDLMLLAPTGSGKTLAFLFPILNVLKKEKAGVQALILTPSRELAMQIEQVWKQMGTGLKATCCYGGHSTRIEKNSLLEAPALLVGTPGRIHYHLRDGNFDPSTVQYLVLDEFDKSLEFGFHDDMAAIISELHRLSKRILTSATTLDDIPEFVEMEADFASVNFLDAEIHKPRITLKAISTSPEEKIETLLSLICHIGNQTTLVFCNHREVVNRISSMLYDNDINHGTFHGGMEQIDREKALLQFRNGTYHLLICTDLASRGLDIPEVACIVHYQLGNEDAYIHRNGRTARMQSTGTAYLLVHDEQLPDYIDREEIAFETLPKENKLPHPTEWVTIYVAAGKKDKVNKIDIVGLFLKKAKLAKEDVGRIEVYDKTSYVAVKRKKARQLLSLLANEKIKNKKVKIGLEES
ncbi:DEAD/DEAH box helicase [Albibacterium profundi]|uniref:DEAD/DEAH box helicase n=1 Tax=Albibacterium profundi TaxID=3134906 RepID=A0ABV5CG45_9SPHI